MLFLVLGLVLLAMKYLEVGPVAGWAWWMVLAPFGLAIVWWWLADRLGHTRRRIERKEEERKQARIAADRKRMGMPPNGHTKR